MEINKIYNENCLETMQRMEDNFIDLTVTSPPYDNLRDYNGYSFDFENIAKELYRVTKDGGVVVWIVGDATIKGSETGTSFKQALFFKEIGFNLNDTMIYRKLNYLPVTSCRYEPQFEYMFILSKGKPKTFNPIMKPNKSAGTKGGTHRHNGEDLEKLHTNNGVIKKEGRKTNVWDIACGSMNSKDKISFKHPATFPEKLATDHIISWSNEEDMVYDCFMGSGTTAKMCILNNRKYIGSEISKEYVDIANKRLIKHKTQNKLF
tara:strand:+ start:795 stop:1583 length:789 start_codon:yes stop_codon:yes gene_type:complete